MSRNRSSCPRSLENRLNREVHNRCPICGGFPLVRAHTIKKFKDVGWNPDYLLAICDECEKKVEKNIISRAELHKIKNALKLCIKKEDGVTPFFVPPITIPNNVKIGSNLITNANTIIQYGSIPILWLTRRNEVLNLNARFFDSNGTVISAIDENLWTADRDRFYDFEVIKEVDSLKLKIFSRRDDMLIIMDIKEDFMDIKEAIFYCPRGKVEIKRNGDLIIGGNTLRSCTANSCNVAIMID